MNLDDGVDYQIHIAIEQKKMKENKTEKKMRNELLPNGLNFDALANAIHTLYHTSFEIAAVRDTTKRCVNRKKLTLYGYCYLNVD